MLSQKGKKLIIFSSQISTEDIQSVLQSLHFGILFQNIIGYNHIWFKNRNCSLNERILKITAKMDDLGISPYNIMYIDTDANCEGIMKCNICHTFGINILHPLTNVDISCIENKLIKL